MTESGGCKQWPLGGIPHTRSYNLDLVCTRKVEVGLCGGSWMVLSWELCFRKVRERLEREKKKPHSAAGAWVEVRECVWTSRHWVKKRMSSAWEKKRVATGRGMKAAEGHTQFLRQVGCLEKVRLNSRYGAGDEGFLWIIWKYKLRVISP